MNKIGFGTQKDCFQEIKEVIKIKESDDSIQLSEKVKNDFQLWDEEDIKTLSDSIDGKALSPFVVEEDISWEGGVDAFAIKGIWILEIIKSKNEPLLNLLIEKYNFTKDEINKLTDYDKLIQNYNHTADINEKITIQDSILRSTETFNEKNLSNFATLPKFLKNQFENNLQRRDGALEWIKNNMNLPSDPVESKQSMKDIISICLSQGETRLAFYMMEVLHKSHSFSSDTDISNRALFHFFLDKYWPYDEKTVEDGGRQFNLEGSTIWDCSYILARILNEELDELKKENVNIKDQSIIEIMEMLVDSLAKCSRWDGTISNEEATTEIIKEIESSKINQPILIPTAIVGHATTVAIQKTSEDKVKITLFNTGLGIEYHGQPYEDELNRMQTYITIEDVPLKDILDREKLANITSRLSDIHSLYQSFNELGKNGRRAILSKKSLDFQKKQKTGVCSAKTIMAFFWRTMIEQVEGSDIHKRGLYDLTRIKVLNRIGDTYLDKSNSKIQALVKNQMEKNLAKLGIVEQIKDQTEYEQQKELLIKILDLVDQEEWCKTFKSESNGTCYEKFYLMTHSHKLIAKACVDNPKLINRLKEAEIDITTLSPCCHILKEMDEMASFYSDQLNQLVEKKEWKGFAELLGKIYFDNSHKQTIIPLLDEVMFQVKNNNKPILKYLTVLFDQYKVLESFYRFLKTNNREDVIDEMKKIQELRNNSK